MPRGSVAQLVERTTENREVTGSTPVGATGPSSGFYWRRVSYFARSAVVFRFAPEGKRPDGMARGQDEDVAPESWSMPRTPSRIEHDHS
jgi:hypothetical protein